MPFEKGDIESKLGYDAVAGFSGTQSDVLSLLQKVEILFRAVIGRVTPSFSRTFQIVDCCDLVARRNGLVENIANDDEVCLIELVESKDGVEECGGMMVLHVLIKGWENAIDTSLF